MESREIDNEFEPSLKPAPGPLRLVQSVVNSLDIDAGRDEWATSAGLGRWLARRRLLADAQAIDEGDRFASIEAREALRQLLWTNNGGPPAPAAAQILTAVAAAGRLCPAFDSRGRCSLVPEADGVAGAMARVVAVAFMAMADGSWSRLKACDTAACRWAFHDRSKNRRGRWCTPDLCGNRMRARAYRERARRRRRA